MMFENDKMDELDNTLLEDNLDYLKTIKSKKTPVKVDMDVTYYHVDDDDRGFEEEADDYLTNSDMKL